MRISAPLLVALLTFAPVAAQEVVTLRFDQPMSTMVDIRHWDETKQQWLDPAQHQDMFFDAVDRFLLLRFPGCAEEIHAKLREGYTIRSVKLTMRWAKQEFERVEGYSGWRTYKFQGVPPPEWHATVWAGRRPWVDDPALGPTWNAYVNGAGYWRAGGAWDTAYDQYPQPLGETLLCARSPEGEVDVTALLTDYGLDPAGALRSLDDCGFVVRKSELFDRNLPPQTKEETCTGVCRIWVTDPALVVTLQRAPRRVRPGSLPPPVDVPALAAQLQARGGGGVPPSRVPENLAELSARVWARPEGVPEWMWQRVLEVRDIKTKSTYLDATLHGDLTSGDPERYAKAVEQVLRQPAGYFAGHSHLDFLIPALRYPELLPEALRYHFRKYAEVRWLPPYDMEGQFHHGVGYYARMATQNHQSQFRSEALLAGEFLGLPDLALHARYALTLYDRQTIFSEGMCQERGDSFYLAISIGTLQAVARLSEDPYMRLKAAMDIEKVLLELSSVYHPGLRREVSRVSRRYTTPEYLLGQDVPLAALHMLSKKGVLMHLDQPEVHGLNTVNFHASNPQRAALLAPWGREWESNVIDEKPLPFLSVATYYERALIDEPLYATTYLGKHYGLGSMNADNGGEQMAVATWKRPAARAESLDDLVIGFIWGNINGKPLLRLDSQGPFGKPTNPLIGVLQRNNKFIYVMKPPHRLFLEEAAQQEGFSEISSRVHVYCYGPDTEREIRINNTPVTQFPATAQAGDVIAIHDGVSYASFRALPATDLGRTAQVVLRYEYPLLTLDNYLLKADQPVAPTEALWENLREATTGWVVEMGDVEEHGSFDNFCAHLEQTQLQSRWEPDNHTLHVSYASGGDTMEMGFLTNAERSPETWRSLTPSQVMAYQRVNGGWPYPDRGVDLDCPLAQMGKGPRLEKGGATLDKPVRQMALLRIEPISGTYEALNPFPEPQPLTLTTPEGVTVRSEGPLSCGRITVRPRENMVWVDYYLPPADGDRALELMQEDARAGKIAGYYPVEQKLSYYFRPDYDVRNIRRDAARALLVSGLEGEPRVLLNDRPLAGPFPRVTHEGKAWYRIPIVGAVTQ